MGSAVEAPVPDGEQPELRERDGAVRPPKAALERRHEGRGQGSHRRGRGVRLKRDEQKRQGEDPQHGAGARVTPRPDARQVQTSSTRADQRGAPVCAMAEITMMRARGWGYCRPLGGGGASALASAGLDATCSCGDLDLGCIARTGNLWSPRGRADDRDRDRPAVRASARRVHEGARRARATPSRRQPTRRRCHGRRAAEARARGVGRQPGLAGMAAEIAGWRTRLPERSGYGIVQAFRQALDAAVRWGDMDRNPAKLAGKNPPRHRAGCRYASGETVGSPRGGGAGYGPRATRGYDPCRPTGQQRRAPAGTPARSRTPNARGAAWPPGDLGGHPGQLVDDPRREHGLPQLGDRGSVVASVVGAKASRGRADPASGSPYSRSISALDRRLAHAEAFRLPG